MVSEDSSGVRLRESGDPHQPAILLWPGLGSTGAYFGGIVGMLPGRAVMADPPGFGRSPRLDPCNFAALVNVARTVVKDRACRAMVGHSLGAHVALGVGCDPPAGLNAIVLIDGGFMTGSGLRCAWHPCPFRPPQPGRLGGVEPAQVPGLGLGHRPAGADVRC